MKRRHAVEAEIGEFSSSDRPRSRTMYPRDVNRTLVPAVGLLTSEEDGSRDPSSRARRTDVRTDALWPRRVASSETATKAMMETTAALAVRRTTGEPIESAALHLADTKHARGRRSGKLAMFFSYARHVSARLRLDESAIPAGFLSNWRLRASKATQRSPRRGRDFGRVRQDCPVR